MTDVIAGLLATDGWSEGYCSLFGPAKKGLECLPAIFVY